MSFTLPQLQTRDGAVSPLVETRPYHELTEADRDHRSAFFTFVVNEAEGWHREHLRRLYARWEAWNSRFFGELLVPPYLMLLEPTNPRAWGDCSDVSGFGGKLQIRIRPSLLTGTHPAIRDGSQYAEGRFRIVEDVLLHEMGHQHQIEVTGQTEDSYKGHGPAFRDECNRIGAALGLPPVRAAKCRGKDKDLPSCAQWPHCVRPPGYYLGALKEPEPVDGDAPAGKAPDPAAVHEALKQLVTQAHQCGVGMVGRLRDPIEGEDPTRLEFVRDLVGAAIRFTWVVEGEDPSLLAETLAAAAQEWDTRPAHPSLEDPDVRDELLDRLYWRPGFIDEDIQDSIDGFEPDGYIARTTVALASMFNHWFNHWCEQFPPPSLLEAQLPLMLLDGYVGKIGREPERNG